MQCADPSIHTYRVTASLNTGPVPQDGHCRKKSVSKSATVNASVMESKSVDERSIRSNACFEI